MVVKASLGVLTLYAIYTLVLSVLAPWMIYPFSDQPFEHASFQIRTIPTFDGMRLPVGVADLGEESPIVLLFQGNSGSRADFTSVFDAYLNAGISLVVMPYRGAEGLGGSPGEGAFKKDALKVFDALPQLLGREPEEIHIMGYSLGSGIALEVAAQREVASVILAAPYGRLCRLAAQKTLAPACWIPWVDRWDSEALSSKINEPVLIVHGTRDALIPAEEGVLLAAALSSDDKEKGAKTTAVFAPFIGHWVLPAALKPVREWLGGGYMERRGMSADDIQRALHVARKAELRR